MHVQIDQSGRFEATNVDTVISFSNGISCSILIPASVKRNCIKIFRENNISGSTLYLQLFSGVIFILLKSHIKKISGVIIDIEYTGKEEKIKEYLLNFFNKSKIDIEPYTIQFARIGKKSPAHFIAISTWRGKKKADIILNEKQLLRIFQPIKKSGTTKR